MYVHRLKIDSPRKSKYFYLADQLFRYCLIIKKQIKIILIIILITIISIIVQYVSESLSMNGIVVSRFNHVYF